jgi:RNA polymerase sigma factor for flagellar operon FliA
MAAYPAFDPDELIRQHTSLVRRIASHICSRLPANVELDDLFQEGMTGLLDAIQRYKPQPNLTFEAYASTRIRGAIYDACRRDDLLPRHQRDKLDQLEKTTRRLEQVLGRMPTEQEVAAALEMSLEDYHGIVNSLVNVMPLDEVPEDMLPTDPYGDPMQLLASRQFMVRMVDILKRLPEKQQLVVALHYQEDLSYREIAAVMSLTPGRISQLHTEAMIAIRALMGSA